MPINTILLLEDDHLIGEMYSRSLRKENYEVTWVTSGTDGVAAVRERAFDLVLLDIMLPEKKGTEVLSQIRAESPSHVGHVIVLTNFDQDEKSRAALQADADAYLIKADITPRRLVQVIREIADAE